MSDSGTPYSIAVIGAGKIGKAVGHLWLGSGHEVCFGVRNPKKLNALVESMGARASAKSIPQAAAAAEIIFLVTL
jgi:predicted dinucleotide-binding enzyme